MKHRMSYRSRLAAGIGAALLGSLAVAGSASAITPPGNVETLNARTDPNPWVFTWTSPGADPEDTVTGFVGGPANSPAETPGTPLSSGDPVPVPEGAAYFRVAAVQAIGGVGPYATLPIFPDRTPPTFGIALIPAQPNAAGWYRNLIIQRTPCADAGGLLPGACEPIAPVPGVHGPSQVTLTDSAGLSTAATVPGYSFDPTIPDANTGVLMEPGPNALVGEEPAFRWTQGADALSGVDHYVLQYREAGDGDWIELNQVAHVNDSADYTARRTAGVAPLPEKTLLEWRVQTFDKAGNFRTALRRELTIDSTIPPAPRITSGPAAPTRNTSPTFTWAGSAAPGGRYTWDLTLAGMSNSVRAGAGPEDTATLQALPDGDYIFRVSEITAAGRKSAEATRSFKVDTTPPAPPTILVRPTFPAITAPVFTWATEPGAYSRWTLLGAGGTPIAGPSDTPATSMTLPALAEGPYTFQVQQIDAAGNVSQPTSEPFTVLAPLSPAPAPRAGIAATVNFLPRQQAMRLKPRPGRVLPTRSPVLQWQRGPRGTRLYNLQIFQVTKTRNARSPKITKVLSRFPKGRQFRAPKKVLKAGTCYVWRVWPYTGRAFTRKPVGVSNFCIANSKVLKKKALQSAARKRLATRSARAAIVRKQR